MSSVEMDYNESMVYKELLENSRTLADNIMKNIRRLGLRFTLDELTLGDGNCFFRGILQQCQREDIYSSLSDEVKVFVDTMDHYGFRKWIKECVFASNHIRVQQETLQPFLPKPWEEYWSDSYMMKNGFWVDAPMVRCTAWFLKMDLMIISEDNNDLQCVTRIPGNIDDETVPAEGPPLCLGLARNHYQSVLPFEDNVSAPDECPVCGCVGKKIIMHITKSKRCKELIGEELLEKWKVQSKEDTKRKAQRRFVSAGKHAKVQSKYIDKRRDEDHEELKANQRKWVMNWRFSNDENDRNKNFLEDSKYGPIFICICCHRKLSKGNVTVFNDKVKQQIKVPLDDCISDMDVYTNIIEFRNGKEVSPNNR